MSDYQPRFERLGTTRRVLGFITDDDHLGRPRNTFDVLVEDLRDDPHTVYAGDVVQMRSYLGMLIKQGLAEQREDGTYAVTDAGRYELTH